MGKFLIEVIIIIVLGFAAQLFFPWWSIAVVAGVVGLFFKFNNSAASYAAGFLAVSLLWGGYAWYLNAANINILAERMGGLLGGLDGSSMLYLTGLLGGLIGGFSAMTGTLARKMFG